MSELMARIKVLLRRAALAGGEGQPVPLTVTEFLLLQALARRPGVVKRASS